jgi:hypothetical protein
MHYFFSVSTHFNRITDSMAAMARTIAFLVLLTAFCIVIAVAYRVIHIAGAMVGLLFATIYYCWVVSSVLK